jgi:hypothetical protein
MTHEELFNLAAEVGLGFIRHASTRERDKFVTFAKLVAEHERNEIIQILDDSTGYVQMDLIRERGQA